MQIFYIFTKLQITINDLTLFWTCWILYEFYDSSHETTFARNSHKNTHDFLTENTIRPLMYVKDQKIPTKFNIIINLVSVVKILESLLVSTLCSQYLLFQNLLKFRLDWFILWQKEKMVMHLPILSFSWLHG